jgi:hypothetical protein
MFMVERACTKCGMIEGQDEDCITINDARERVISNHDYRAVDDNPAASFKDDDK